MQIKKQSIAFNILNNFKGVNDINPIEQTVELINDNFNKGLIDELTVEQAFEQLDNVIQKSAPHKYFKREGVPGNYKYYYTEEEYNKAKGTKDKKEDGNIVDNVNNGEVINSLFKEWNSIKTPEQHKEWAKKVANTKFGTYEDKTILNVMSDFNPRFPNEIIKKDFINEVQEAYKNSEVEKEDKGSFENDIKVGDKIKGSSGVTKDKIGTVTSINGDMAQVDFGGGDKYGITLRRIKEGEFTKEELEGVAKKGEGNKKENKGYKITSPMIEYLDSRKNGDLIDLIKDYSRKVGISFSEEEKMDLIEQYIELKGEGNKFGFDTKEVRNKENAIKVSDWIDNHTNKHKHGQLHFTNKIREKFPELGKYVYFDDTNLVVGEKTVVANAYDKNLKEVFDTIQEFIKINNL